MACWNRKTFFCLFYCYCILPTAAYQSIKLNMYGLYDFYDFYDFNAFIFAF
jgi:hypothetical protein